MRNKEIREAARIHGVKLWQVAEKLGITDASFSRKLRREFSDEEKEKVLEIIQELAKNQEADNGSTISQ